jgi:hypothetical protein
MSSKITTHLRRYGHRLALGATLASFIIIGILAVTSARTEKTHDPVPTIAACDVEDGSSQSVCWWHDETHGWFLNISHGKGTYVPATDTLNTY